VIEEIRIRGLGVIDDAVLEPHAGFTVLTGETGAGKTMVLSGLALLMGGRADAGVIRHGGNRAEVEGRVRVSLPAVLDRVADAGGELDDGVLVLVRTLAAEGRSRAFVGGRSVPVSVLSELADELVAVHGQSDQQRLLAPARQRAALDRFAGEPHARIATSYRATYEQLREVDRYLVEITEHARDRAREADILRAGLADIDSVEPVLGEWEDLRADSQRLAHAESLRDAAESAHRALRGDTDSGPAVDAISLLDSARRTLDSQRGHDPALGQWADGLGQALSAVSDTASELASYAASVESDPLRLAHVHERIAALTGLMRKYGATVEEVVTWRHSASARLLELDGDDERLEQLSIQRMQLRARLGELGVELSASRSSAAVRFAADVTRELTDLAMPNARLSVDIRQADSADGLEVDIDGAARRLAFGTSGIDEVELLLAPHAGAPARPISKGASGGELSRVMLAVEVVFAGADPVPTLVFDEVDSGVGGKAAVEVGRRLARLARTSQVLIVTHLPQVAAFADRHVMVEKNDDGQITTSGLRVLDDAGRVGELARMLAGLEGSTSAKAHARELLDLAAAEREPELAAAAPELVVRAKGARRG